MAGLREFVNRDGFRDGLTVAVNSGETAVRL